MLRQAQHERTDKSAKLQHWRGFWRQNGLGGSPVLVFRLAGGDCVSAWALAAFRDLLVGVLCGRRGDKLLFDMKNHIKIHGMIRGGLECYADAMLHKLS